MLNVSAELTGMKAIVEQLRSEYAFSERRAGQLIGLPVFTCRYEPHRTMPVYASNSWFWREKSHV